MRKSKIDAIRDSLSAGVQIWNGNLWNPEWFEQFDTGEIGSGEILSLRYPELVLNEHRALLDAGADALSTNTFGATRAVMEQYGMADLVAEANFEAARLARRVADEGATEHRRPWVLGSIGPTLHSLTLMGGGKKRFDDVMEDYRFQARALWQGGVDLLHVEMCQDCLNARAALLAIKAVEAETGNRIPTMVTAGIEATGTMLEGTTPESFWTAMSEFAPDVFGFCSAGPLIFESLEKLPDKPDVHKAALIDVFRVASREGWFETPESLRAVFSPRIRNQKLSIVGVGVAARPEYVQALAALLTV